MARREDQRASRSSFEDVLELFGWKWTRFWAWLDTLGHNAPPVPRSRATDPSGAERSKRLFPPE